LIVAIGLIGDCLREVVMSKKLKSADVENVKRGISVGVGRGDVLCDVVKYWSHVCAHPNFLFRSATEWQHAEVELDSGAVQIYSNFTEFIDGERKKEAKIDAKLADEGIDLAEDIDPERAADDDDVREASVEGARCQDENQDDGDEDAHEFSISDEICIKTRVVDNIRHSGVSQQVFWNMTCRLVPAVRKHAQRVHIPSRYHMTECLRRLSQKIHDATAKLRLNLNQVPTAYNDDRYHTLYLIITPHMRKSSSQADCLFYFYNNTAQGGIYNSLSPHVSVRYSDLKHLHPMFEHACWRDMFFKVATLANYKSLFVNFNFHVGLHHQYLNVFEQSFELLRHQEIESVGGATTGAITSFFKNVVEEEDYQSGRAPQWIYEFDIPDENWAPRGISAALPTYKGMRVRFMFREDHAAWFF
jgi:hypothetical protein